VKNISALQDVSSELCKAIFGVDLFMIRDRDGLTDEQVKALETPVPGLKRLVFFGT
jgi:hypothetical protein